MHSFIKLCKYLEHLISVQTLLLFDGISSAVKITDTDKELFFVKKQCFFFKKKKRRPGAPTKVGLTFFPEICASVVRSND